MVIEEKNINVAMESNVGLVAKKALLRAKLESRVIIGLSEAAKCLTKEPNDSLFCFIAPPQKGDSATHMHEVLIQAFCFENDIYIIKVDSSEKLSRILGITTMESCALIQRTFDHKTQNEVISKIEDNLIDHCEAFWDAPKQPVISLPES